MTFRTRLLTALLVVAWLPLLALGLVIRSVGSGRLTDSHERRMSERGEEVVLSWARSIKELDGALEELEQALRDDNRVRASFRSLPSVDPAIQAATGRFAAAAGLEVVYVLAADGIIVGASHFAGDVGRSSVGSMEAPGGGGAGSLDSPPQVADVPFPGGDRRQVLRSRPTRIAGIPVLLVAGMSPSSVTEIESDELELVIVRYVGDEPDWSSAVSLEGGAASSVVLDPQGYLPVGAIRLEGSVLEGAPVALVLAWRNSLLPTMLSSFDRALLVSLVAAAMLAGLFSHFLARRLVRPIDRLTDAARRVHLGSLDVSFGKGGGGEFDRLSGFLNGMMFRLSEGVGQLKEAERRATVGELARQVNHDVRNGLVPIRNVVAHLADAHRESAGTLATAFEQRSSTLDRSLAYLDGLADQYRAVASHGSRGTTSLNEVVSAVVAMGAKHDSVNIVAQQGPGAAWVQIDSVSLRRIVENLVSNAEAALSHTGGTIVVGTRAAEPESDGPGHELTVSDDGPGIPEEDRSRLFEPFFTTREGGTGLGLAIVRRLVSDVGGRVVLESEVGIGTRVRVFLRGAERSTEGSV